MKQKKLRFGATLALCMLFGLVVQATTTTTFDYTQSDPGTSISPITLTLGSSVSYKNGGYLNGSTTKQTIAIGSTTAGGNITNVEVTFLSSYSDGYKVNPTMTSGTYSLSSNVGTWTKSENVTSVTFTFSKKFRITKIVVTTDGKGTPTIAFPSPTATVDVGSTVTNAATITPSGLSVAYSSSNTAAATVDASGVVTGVATGTATITAAYTETSDYAAASATYDITVNTAAPTLTASTYFTTSPFSYTITVPTGENVYYTLDGNVPTTESTQGTSGGTTSLTFTPEGNTKSLTVKAIAYSGTTASGVVTATYTYGIAAPTLSNNYNYSSGETSKTVKITAADGATIYYTTDGSTPTTSSNQYTAAFSITTFTTVKAIAVSGDLTSTVATQTYAIKDANTYAMSESDAEGVVPGTSKNVTVDGKVLITMTFGGSSATDTWGKLNKGKNGDFLGGASFITDGYIINNDNDAMNESSTITDKKASGGDYTHNVTLTDYAKTYKRTFDLLPAYGNYFMFEPQKNGTLVIYAEQQGSIYNKSGVFDKTKMRKRPVYLLDEFAHPIAASAIETTSRVDDNWNSIVKADLTGDDGIITTEQSKLMYDLNSAWISANDITAGSALSPYQGVIVLHHSSSGKTYGGTYSEAVTNALSAVNNSVSDNNSDNTGYMLISEGYVRYEFPVVAGKTYFFFGYKTKVGVCAFALENYSGYTNSGTIELNEGSLGTDASYTPTSTTVNNEALTNNTLGNQYDITVNRTFTAGKWYSVVLPFSIGPAHIKSIFGNTAMVIHFDDINGINGNVLNLKKHYQQMTTARVPFLIKPSQNVENPTFKDVTFFNVETAGDATTTAKDVESITVGNYMMTGSYEPAMMPAYSYFMTNTTVDGVLKSQFSQYNSTESHGIKALRSWLTTTTSSSSAKRLVYAIDGVVEDDETTDISEALVDENDSAAAIGSVYNINGQQVRPSGSSMEGLPKGIYIVNGKKHVVR